MHPQCAIVHSQNRASLISWLLVLACRAAHAENEEPPPVPPEDAQGQVPSETTYDLLRDAESRVVEVEEEVKSFEFHGYFRAGYGLNSVGGQQVAFQAPGADVKFRLGNAAETYSELVFVHDWLNPEHTPGKLWAKALFMIEANTSNSASYANFPSGIGNDNFRLREAFVQIGNVVGSFPDAKLWAGERYYRRYQVHIDDFFFLNMSGYGGGVEDVDAKIGKVAVSGCSGPACRSGRRRARFPWRSISSPRASRSRPTAPSIPCQRDIFPFPSRPEWWLTGSTGSSWAWERAPTPRPSRPASSSGSR